MPLRLLHLSLPDLQKLSSGRLHIEKCEVALDSFPMFLVDAAIKDVSQGKPLLWHSLFLYVAGARPQGVGSAAFRGPPRDGRVEIGYGIAKEHQGRGFATVGLRLMLEQAFMDSNVNEVYAENAVTNELSERVLIRNGFFKIGQRDSEEDGLVNCWLCIRGTSDSCIERRA